MLEHVGLMNKIKYCLSTKKKDLCKRNLQTDVRAYLHGAEVIKRFVRVEEVASEYGFNP